MDHVVDSTGTTNKDLVGCRFGSLTVISKTPPQKSGYITWVCQCDCGKHRNVKGTYLRKGSIFCCLACAYAPEDYSGRKIGLLTVVNRAPDKINKDGHPIVQWNCICECGSEIVRGSYHLKRGRCSCLDCKAKIDRAKNRKWHGGIPSMYWTSVRRNAGLRKLDFTVTIEEAWNLYLSQNGKCAISGLDIPFATSKREHLGGGSMASLDRVNSNLGYHIENVQRVHKWINLMKSDFTMDEFLELCRAIVNHQASLNS